MPKCMKCGAHDCIKNGKVFGSQRYKCKNCGYQFTKEAPHGKPIQQKLLVHDLYASGLSMREIARLVGVTVQTVSRWINKWHSVYQFEQTAGTVLYRVNRQNILDCLDIHTDDDCVLVTHKLSSGAKISILMQPPC